MDKSNGKSHVWPSLSSLEELVGRVTLLEEKLTPKNNQLDVAEEYLDACERLKRRGAKRRVELKLARLNGEEIKYKRMPTWLINAALLSIGATMGCAVAFFFLY